MKGSTLAFWMLIILTFLITSVTIFAIVNPSEKNNEILGLFFDIMTYIITLVGGGYLGVQIGEKYPIKRLRK